MSESEILSSARSNQHINPPTVVQNTTPSTSKSNSSALTDDELYRSIVVNSTHKLKPHIKDEVFFNKINQEMFDINTDASPV